MTEEQFCKIYSGFCGEKIDKAGQVITTSFDGETLLDFINLCLEQYEQGQNNENVPLDNTGANNDRNAKFEIGQILNKNLIINNQGNRSFIDGYEDCVNEILQLLKDKDEKFMEMRTKIQQEIEKKEHSIRNEAQRTQAENLNFLIEELQKAKAEIAELKKERSLK